MAVKEVLMLSSPKKTQLRLIYVHWCSLPVHGGLQYHFCTPQLWAPPPREQRSSPNTPGLLQSSSASSSDFTFSFICAPWALASAPQPAIWPSDHLKQIEILNHREICTISRHAPTAHLVMNTSPLLVWHFRPSLGSLLQSWDSWSQLWKTPSVPFKYLLLTPVALNDAVEYKFELVKKTIENSQDKQDYSSHPLMIFCKTSHLQSVDDRFMLAKTLSLKNARKRPVFWHQIPLNIVFPLDFTWLSCQRPIQTNTKHKSLARRSFSVAFTASKMALLGS